MSARRRVAITVACCCVVLAAVLAVTLLLTPYRIIRTNHITVAPTLGAFPRHATVCQERERIPALTSALRISLESDIGPALSATISHGDRTVATAKQSAGWASGSVTFALHPRVAQPVEATICMTRGSSGFPLELYGNNTPKAVAAAIDGRPLEGRLRVEYLRTGNRSWLALARQTARRLGLVHTPSGAWISLPLLAMMVAAVALCAWLLIRDAET